MSIWDKIFNPDPLSDRAILRNARRTGRKVMRQYRRENSSRNWGKKSSDGNWWKNTNGQDDEEEQEGTGFDANSFMTKTSSVLGGITGLVENYDRGASIQDTEGLENQIQEYGNIGRGTYNDYDQLASDFGQLDLTPDIDEDEIRGLTTGQKWGTIGSGVATGAAAGAAFGGIGAAVGAGIGAITSGLSILAGDEEARKQKEYLENLKSVASQKATINLGLAHEDIRERRNREGIYNLSAQGGKIRRMSSLQEFADTVLNSSSKNDVSHSARIVRSKCKGGTMIRVKVR